MSIKAKISPLTTILVINEPGLRSGSGSKPNGYGLTGISSILVRGH
jgi:hypothetical protein